MKNFLCLYAAALACLFASGCEAREPSSPVAPNAKATIAAAQTGGALPPGSFRMQPVEIKDGDLTAFTLFIPAGWQSQGQIVWQNNMPSCGPNGTHVNWMAASPEGEVVLHIFPEETWTGSSMQAMGQQGNCPNIHITHVRDYLNWYVQRNRPNAQILDYRDRPDILEGSEKLEETQNLNGIQLRNWVQAGEILIAYEHQGQAMRESIVIVVYFMHMRMADGMGGAMDQLTIAAQPGMASRAPAGKLDFQLIETVRKSIQPNPQWLALMAEHHRKMSEIANRGARERHQITMDSMRDVAAINNQIYENRQASNERSGRRFNEAIRGVGTYTDPTTQRSVELPHTHSNAWRLNDGTYILTDDANFQPYRDLGVDGQQLELNR